MKKIAIVPLAFKSYNYGGTLQYYALMKALNSIGYDSSVLDIDEFGDKLFCNDFDTKTNSQKLLYKVLHRLEWEFANWKTKKIKNRFEKRNTKFSEFRNEYVKSYFSTDLKDLNDKFDGFVSGSDQIWNPMWSKTTFFLDFVNESVKIIYGASIGRRKLNDDQKKKYAELLADIDAVSVRERDAISQLSPYTNKKLELVIDPVFLIGVNEWLNLIKPYQDNDRFIFSYLLGEDKKYRKQIIELKKKLDFKVVSIPYITQRFVLHEDYADLMEMDAGPIDFLRFIYSADLVVTDSFHATAFSLIFHKNFWVLNREPDNSQMLSRITTLLSYFGLEDRLVDTLDSIENKKIDWKEIDNKIESLRENSINFLNNALLIR